MKCFYYLNESIMRKFFLLLATCAVALVSCKKDNAPVPTVSFKSIAPEMSFGAATFTLDVKGYNGQSPVEIPVVFGGTAAMGVDYTVSSKSFVWGGDKPVETITVTPTETGLGKSVTLKLSAPAGFAAGRYMFSEVKLLQKKGYLSFIKSNVDMSESVTIEVGAFNENGKALSVDKEVKIPVKVIAEKSTAVEGEHFTIDGDKYIVIPQNKSVGSVTLRMKGENIVENKDMIVLAFEESSEYGIGQRNEISVRMVGPTTVRMAGKWVADQFVTDLEYMKSYWWDMLTYNGFPEFNAEDAITFDMEKNVLIPSFKSAFKDYFIGESRIVKKGEMFLMLSTGERIQLQQLEIDNTNRYFSPNEKSDDKVSLIGVRLIEKDGEEILDLYVIDYISKSFCPELETSGMYHPEKPVATMSGVPLNYTFRRAK